MGRAGTFCRVGVRALLAAIFLTSALAHARDLKGDHTLVARMLAGQHELHVAFVAGLAGLAVWLLARPRSARPPAVAVALLAFFTSVILREFLFAKAPLPCGCFAKDAAHAASFAAARAELLWSAGRNVVLICLALPAALAVGSPTSGPASPRRSLPPLPVS